MKSLILASVIAVTSVFSYSPPTQAASVTVTENGQVIVRDRNHQRKREMRRNRNNRVCYIRTTKHRYHGRVVIKKVRVCDRRY